MKTRAAWWMHRAASALLLVVVSCRTNGGSAGLALEIDTLPGGTIVVSNPARGLWGPAEAWRLVEDLRIGSVDGDGASALGQVQGLAVGADGRIYVLDYLSQDVRVFDRDGRYIRSVGRKGDGPGELRGAWSLALDAGQRLWVLDRQAGRYSVFDTTGAFAGSFPRSAPFMRAGFIWGVAPSGELIDSWSVSNLDPPSDNTGPEQTAVLRLRPGQEARDSLLLPPFERLTYDIVIRRGNTTNAFRFPVPFSSDELVALDPRGFVWRALSGTFEIAQLSLEGDTVRLVRRDFEPVPVSEQQRDRALAPVREIAERAGQTVDDSRVPAVWPALIGMLVDDQGHLWVCPSGRSAERFVLDVFDAEGRYLGAVQTAMRTWRRSPHPVVRGSHLYYLETDSLDVPYVVRARIVGRD